MEYFNIIAIYFRGRSQNQLVKDIWMKNWFLEI